MFETDRLLDSTIEAKSTINKKTVVQNKKKLWLRSIEKAAFISFTRAYCFSTNGTIFYHVKSGVYLILKCSTSGTTFNAGVQDWCRQNN